MQKNGVQVGEGYYSRDSYMTLERFISYFHQAELAEKYGVRSILEIGGGPNVVSELLKKKGIKVTKCDIDPSTDPDLTADVRKIPLPDKNFDAVMAFQILEHIPFEEFGSALEELKRLSRKYIFISLPYRSTGFECVMKFPGIRKLFQKNFWDFWIRIPLRFGGFSASGQHYWEIDGSKYPFSRVKSEIAKHGRIVDSFSPALNKYHYFFVIEVNQKNG